MLIKVTHTDGTHCWIAPDTIAKIKTAAGQVVIKLKDGSFINSGDKEQDVVFAVNAALTPYNPFQQAGYNPYMTTQQHISGGPNQQVGGGGGGGYGVGSGPIPWTVAQAPTTGNLVQAPGGAAASSAGTGGAAAQSGWLGSLLGII